MSWKTEPRGSALVGHWAGHVDESNWEAFRDALVAAVATAHAAGQLLVIDLAGLTYMSSRGLRALSAGLAAANAGGVPMRLAAPGPEMRKILQISRYDSVFVIHDSVSAAMADG